jgi:hypothetical protein
MDLSLDDHGTPRPPVVLRLAGAVIGFEISSPHLAEVVGAFAHASVEPTDTTPGIWYRHAWFRGRMRFLRDDPLRTVKPTPVGTTVKLLLDDLQLSVALHATDDVFVHAGVVACDGRAIVLPGRSRVGKSSLVEALVRAGATYCSDEYARLTPDGRIAPFARPIQQRGSAGREIVDPYRLGAVADGPVEPGIVLFTRYVAEAAFAPVVVPPARAALDVFDNTVIAEVDPDRAIEAAAGLARRSVTIRTHRGEVDVTTDAILAMVQSVESPT